MRVADQIFSLTPARLSRRQLDTAITVLMLLPSGVNAQLGYDGVRESRYGIDHGLVAALLDAARDVETQRAIVHSPAFASLPPRQYRRLFFRLWPSRRGNAWRWTFGWSLHSFLSSNPKEARFYARAIWTIASDPDETVALAGLASIKHLGKVLTLKQAAALVAMSHHPTDRALAALSNLGELYKSFATLEPDVRSFLAAPATIATLRSANPRDGRGASSAYRWCLTNLRKALGPRSVRGTAWTATSVHIPSPRRGVRPRPQRASGPSGPGGPSEQHQPDAEAQ